MTARTGELPKPSFRLYVAGGTPSSSMARANLAQLLGGVRHELEIVDVVQTPDRALEDGISITPTLVRVSPGPQVMLFGDLSSHATVLAALDLRDKPLGMTA